MKTLPSRWTNRHWRRDAAYAQRHGTTLNSLVRDLLRRATVEDRNRTVAELFRLMDAHAGDSRGETWTREDLVRSS